MQSVVRTVALVVLACASAAFARVDQDSIVGLWLFDEADGDTARDSSRKGNDGTLMEGPTRVAGRLKDALLFDGVDDYVVVEHDPTLDITEEITIFAWAKLETIPAHEWVMLDKGPQAGSAQYYVAYEPAENAFMLNFNGAAWHAGDDFNSPPVGPDLEWHHMAASFHPDSDTIIVCVDGDCATHTTDDDLVSKGDEPLVIGTARFLQDDVAWYFNGALDEVGVLDVALNETDMASLLGGVLAVAPGSRLATRWGDLKRR